MKKVKRKGLIVLVLVLLLSWIFQPHEVFALTSFQDDGSSPGGWTWLSNRLWSSSGMSGGPPSGNGGSGSYYYFGSYFNDTEIGSARVCKVFYFSNEEKKLLQAGQLKIACSLYYYGWTSDQDDYFDITVKTGRFTSSGEYLGDPLQTFAKNNIIGNREWRKLTVCDGNLVDSSIPLDNAGVLVTIYAGRRDGDDLDVYLDDIELRLYDDVSASIIDNESAADGSLGKIVEQIIDKDNVPHTPVKGSVNWVNPGDTIKGTLAFNEYVRASTVLNNLNINVQGSSGRIRGYMVSGGSTMDAVTQKPYSTNDARAFEYRIPLAGAAYMEDSIIKLMNMGERMIGTKVIHYPWPINKTMTSPVIVSCGPFDYPVLDLGGNYGINRMDANFDAYNLKLDSAVPVILTSQEQYAAFAVGRTSVTITVREEDKGREQSPLALSYYWKYYNSNNVEVIGTPKDLLISSTITPVRDATGTTYTVPVNIPAGADIPPYQEFRLYVKAEDAARNSSGAYMEFKVGQKDLSPPDIAWEKSVYEDGTEVSLTGTAEDTGYAKSRTVVFTASDSDSGVDTVKYLWSASPLENISDSVMALAQPEGGKYRIAGSGALFSTEGTYRLYVKAVNKTGTGKVYEKAFNFDNEAPRAGRVGAAPDLNPAEIQYLVQDRSLNNKLLYTVAAYNSSEGKYEAVPEPVIAIAEGLKDNGMWRVLACGNAGDTTQTAHIAGFGDMIRQTGKYKLIARLYDTKFNYTQVEEELQYDLTAPQLQSVVTGDPSIFRQGHDVEVVVTDNPAGVKQVAYKWVAVDGGEPEQEYSIASYTVNNRYRIESGSSLNGKYYIRVKLTDQQDNEAEEALSIDGSRAEFCFDNSPPTVSLSWDAERTARTLRFAYSEPEDAYTSIASFRYGIAAAPDSEPAVWIDIVPQEGGGVVEYPGGFETDGERYLYVRLQDAVGNIQAYGPMTFRIDVTKPTGKASFNAAHTNKLDILLNLEVDELKDSGSTPFKTVLSNNRDQLADAAIADIPPEAWKDIRYEDGEAVYQWTLSDTADGEQQVYVRFKDEAGNLSDIYEAGILLDRTAPTGAINYDITAPTKSNVTAVLTVTDNFSDSEITLLNNGGENTYTFNRNGTFEFIFTDGAGNKGRATAAVDYIDREPPTGYVAYSRPRDIWTNQSIMATLYLDDPDATVTSPGGANHTFEENGTFTFSFKDSLGNQGSITAEVKNIDKTAPEGYILYTYSDTAPVTVYLAVYEPVEVTNNDGSFRHMFDTNGAFTFTFKDKAGNSGQATAVVDTITFGQKYVNVEYSESKLTNGSVDVHFKPITGLSCITSPTVTEAVYAPNVYTHHFTENGDAAVAIRILSGAEEGNLRTVVGSVYNIDTTPPEAYVYLSTGSLTNQSVTAMLLPYDDKGKAVSIKNNNGASERVFAENGSFTFDFEDEAGNIGHKTVTVSNIDKTAPAAGITYDRDAAGNIVTARISFPGETDVEILNNNGNDTFEFIENGVFTFRYADKAGNTGELKAQVGDLTESVSAGVIKYYIDSGEIDDPNAGTTNKDITAELSFTEGTGPYTVKNNGGSSSYVFDRNGEFTFIFEDGKGNRGFATAKVGMIDKEAPLLEILANTVKATNQDVTVTISYSDNKGIASTDSNLEAENMTVSEGRITYRCKANKQIWVEVTDTAGNKTRKEFNVVNIDREAPVGTITYSNSSKTNQPVKAVLSLSEPGTVQNNNGKPEYTFTENGSFTFEFSDPAGNPASRTATVDWIDKLPPSVILEYSETAPTNKAVEVTVKADEAIIVLNNGGAVKRVFNENGTYTFNVSDIAGNQVSIEAKVENIDTVKPEILLNGPANTIITQNEVYMEAGCSAADNADGNLTGNVTVEGSVNTAVPGTYKLTYKVRDLAGNENTAVRMVRVAGPDEIILVLNGIPAEADWMTLNSRSIKVGCYGNEGSYSIKWAEGKKTQAFFKSEGNAVAPETTVEMTNNNWYTFFIQDRERKTQSIQVYINE